MKGWLIVLGRGGTVLLSVGLALLLVSLIPSAQLSSSTTTGEALPAASWWGVDLWELTSQQTLTPQQTLHITINTTGAINITLIGTSVQAISNWMTNTTNWSSVTYFDAFLKSNPTLIIWQREVDNGTIDYDYVPTEVVNVDQVNMSLVTSNYGSNYVDVQYAGSVESGVAPTAKVRTLSEFVIPIGAVLTLPWLNEIARGRKKVSPH